MGFFDRVRQRLAHDWRDETGEGVIKNGRAKVESIRSHEPEVPASERQQSHDKAVRYSQLALR